MATTPGTRTPRSAKIPQWSVEAVVPHVQALSDLAGPATNARIGQQLGTSPAGGKFRSKMGTAGYYGFIKKDGDLNVLTPRGEALIGDDEAAAVKARREAVMSTPFGQVIRKFASREPNEGTIAARLEDDFASPAESATYLAQTLVKAAREAALISNGRFDAAAIEEYSSVVQTVTPAAVATSSSGVNATTKASTPKPKAAAATKPKETEVVVEKERPFAPGVQVVVKVDASSLTPQQIAELIRELQKPTT
jgi:hypothetical protein